MERSQASLPSVSVQGLSLPSKHEGRLRPPNVVEREVIMGFPAGYTNQCYGKALQGTLGHEDCRLTLVGNSWHVGVIAWLLSQLLVPLGLTSPLSLQDIVDRLAPGGNPVLQVSFSDPLS